MVFLLTAVAVLLVVTETVMVVVVGSLVMVKVVADWSGSDLALVPSQAGYRQ